MNTLNVTYFAPFLKVLDWLLVLLEAPDDALTEEHKTFLQGMTYCHGNKLLKYLYRLARKFFFE